MARVNLGSCVGILLMMASMALAINSPQWQQSLRAQTSYFTYVPDTPVPNEPITFTSTIPRQHQGSDSEIIDWFWNFGDGSPEQQGETVTHTFTQGGTFTITLTVVHDNRGTLPFTQTFDVATSYRTDKVIGNCDADTNNCPRCVGNPIYPSSGNKHQSEQDYMGIGAFPLDFQRAYNSLSTLTGDVGSKWSHSYSAHLHMVTPTLVNVVRGDQKTLAFTLQNGIWTSDADVMARLAQTTDTQGNLTGWRYTTGTDSTELYDASGRLLSLVQRSGLTQNIEYDAMGRVQTVSDPFGRQLLFTYDTSNRIQQVLDPAQNAYGYAYDANNNLVAVTYQDGTKRRYLYEYPQHPNALTGIEDENGIRFATFAYDASGLAISSEHAGGAGKVTVAYGGGQATVTDALGKQQELLHQVVQGVPRETDAMEQCASCTPRTMQNSYDANGNITRMTDFNGNVTTYVYDLARNLETSRTEAVGTPQERIITTEWHPTFRLIARMAEPLRITTNAYDDDGTACGARGARCSATVQATTDMTGAEGFSATPTGAPRTWRYRYNSNGQVVRVDGPRTDVPDVTTYTYYRDDHPDMGKRGKLATITNALGHETRITAYDAHGNPMRLTDPNGLVTVLRYDTRQRLISRTVGTEKTTFAYDGVGQLKKVTLPDSSFLTYSYDAAHRLTSMQDSLGNIITYTLDAMGNRTKEVITDDSGAITLTRSRVYNALNRLIQEIGASHQTTVYDHDDQGNVITVTDPLQHTTTNSFDALHRLSAMLDPENGTTAYVYDGLDQRIGVTDPRNLTTQYTTTGLGDRTQTISPDTGTTASTFDRAGNLKTDTDARGEKQVYSYDVLNRVTGITNPLRSFTYDEGENGIGRLTTMTDPAGVTQWRYDQYGRVTQKTQSLGAVILAVQYGYNAAGQMREMVLPSGKTLTYSYDSMGRVRAVSVDGIAILTNLHYQPFGPPKSWRWGSGKAYSRSFDLDGRMVSYPLGSTIRTLHYDAASRITGFTHSDATPSQTFGYDDLDRLTRFNAATDTYNYDAVGNRISLALGTDNDSYSYAATSNRLLAITGTHPQTYGYDEAGNTEIEGGRTYVYDGRRRLIQVSEGGNISRYAINALGERMRKSSTNQSATRFLYDEAGHMLGEYRATSGQVRQEFVWLGNMPIAVLQGAQAYYIYADHLHTPRVITNTANTVVWRWNHDDPFGNNPADEDPDGDGKKFVFNLRFPGQYLDKETGLHYNGFRDYDPTTGRYIQSDPIGPDGGLNTYGYVGGNPIMGIDPMGLLTVHIWNFRGSSEAWGHASITLNDSTYISWWPSTSRSYFISSKLPLYSAPPFLESYEQGVEWEGQSPDHNIRINGLDEDEIKKWWNAFKDKNQWSTLDQNCSSTVADALAAGGANFYAALAGFDTNPVIPWIPDSILDYSNAINRGMSRWGSPGLNSLNRHLIKTFGDSTPLLGD